MARLLPTTLNKYVEMARPILIQKAKQEGRITYKELTDRLGGCPGRAYIGEVVGRISEIEWEEKCLKLSAVVVRSDTQMVGGGFFGLPNTPETIRRSTRKEWQNPCLSEADREEWHRQLEKVYRYWREHDC